MHRRWGSTWWHQSMKTLSTLLVFGEVDFPHKGGSNADLITGDFYTSIIFLKDMCDVVRKNYFRKLMYWNKGTTGHYPNQRTLPFQCWLVLRKHYNTIAFSIIPWQWDVRNVMMTSSNGNIFHVTGHFVRGIHQSVTQSFDVFFDLRLNKRWSKQWWGWWSETPSCSLCRHCNVLTYFWWKTNTGLFFGIATMSTRCSRPKHVHVSKLGNHWYR